MWAHEVERVREATHQNAEDHDYHFERFRREYFFIDLYPENDHRFPVTIEDCRGND